MAGIIANARRLSSEFHLDAAALEEHHAKAFEPWERGEIALDEYLDAVVFYEPRSFTHEEFFNAMCEQSKLLADGATCILKELAASDRVHAWGAQQRSARDA